VRGSLRHERAARQQHGRVVGKEPAIVAPARHGLARELAVRREDRDDVDLPLASAR
jgi:hypothetical protein